MTKSVKPSADERTATATPTICRESGEPHAVYTDGSVCRCEILPPDCTCRRKPQAAHAADCALVQWEAARISSADGGSGGNIVAEPTGRQIEARHIKPGDRIYFADLDANARLVVHVEPVADSRDLLVVYQGGGFEDLTADTIVTVVDLGAVSDQ